MLPFITILIWNAENSVIPVALYLYSLKSFAFSDGVTVTSSLPSVLNGVQFKSSIFLTSSADVALKNTLTVEVERTDWVNLTSRAVDGLSNVIGLVHYTAADDEPVGC